MLGYAKVQGREMAVVPLRSVASVALSIQEPHLVFLGVPLPRRDFAAPAERASARVREK